MGSELRVAVPQRFPSGRIGSLVIIVLRVRRIDDS